MNEIRLKGTLKFPPRTHGSNVFVVLAPEGEQGGVDIACWAEEAPEACAALAKAVQGSKVSIMGKLVRGKDKLLAKVDQSGAVTGEAWVLKVNALKVRVEAAPVAPPQRQADDEIQF